MTYAFQVEVEFTEMEARTSELKYAVAAVAIALNGSVIASVVMKPGVSAYAWAAIPPDESTELVNAFLSKLRERGTLDAFRVTVTDLGWKSALSHQ